MPADLQQIVEAARRGGGLMVSHHYRRHRVGQPDRPAEETILDALRAGDAVLISDDQGRGDGRGAVCRIVCRAQGGRRMAVRVNYERRPMRIVTAYWLARDG